MPNRSYISIFNGALLTAAFLAVFVPAVVAERVLVPHFSSQYSQIELAEYSSQRSSGGRILLLGDSTIRNLHAREADIESDLGYTNLAAGGAMTKEWYYSLRNVLRVSKDFKAVVAGMSNGQAMEALAYLPPYYPFLLDTRDAWEEYRSGHFDWATAGRLLVYLHSKVIFTKDDLIYGIASDYFPSIKHLLMDLKLRQKAKEGLHLEAPGDEPPDFSRRFEGPERLKRAADAHGLKIFFVLSPLSKEIRESQHYKDMRKVFTEACASLKLRCADFSDKIPDRCFTPDGVHLMEQYTELYKELIEALLKSERLL